MENKEYTAIIHLSIEIFDVEKTGEISGKTITPQQYKELEIKPKQLMQIKGKDLKDCAFKLKNKLEEFKRK